MVDYKTSARAAKSGPYYDRIQHDHLAMISRVRWPGRRITFRLIMPIISILQEANDKCAVKYLFLSLHRTSFPVATPAITIELIRLFWCASDLIAKHFIAHSPEVAADIENAERTLLLLLESEFHCQ